MAKKAIIIGVVLIMVFVAMAAKEFYSMRSDGHAECNFCHVTCDVLPLDVHPNGKVLSWQIVCPVCGRRAKILDSEADFIHDTEDRLDTRPIDTKSSSSEGKPEKPDYTITNDVSEMPETEIDTKGRELSCASCGRDVDEHRCFWYNPRSEMLAKQSPSDEGSASGWVPICKKCAIKYFYSEREGIGIDNSGTRKP
ncbi:MAG: hypothetical protein ACLFSQ_09865 [Candidatus Zixiibacteriota bacterium]